VATPVNRKKVVTVRSVRILLAAVALIAAGLTGWALGTCDDRDPTFCAEASTADYLANSLTTPERPILQIRREGTPLADLTAALRAPSSVLVVDDDAGAGLDLVNAHQMINYDLVPDLRRMLVG
jgi:hypothetical protein